MKTPTLSMFCILTAPLLGGMLCYEGVMVPFVTAFKRGGGLYVLYPIYASTFIFAAIGAGILYKEPIHLVNLAGMGLLVAGMLALALSIVMAGCLMTSLRRLIKCHNLLGKRPS
jgi:multidrug transporter EmrE-like cation transporter